ncbi:Aldo keto reductase [Coniophora puteana RWD-64-598 SS2]|uniref:Aldo keto reductase n=1 Tax=Coniophora puteana (strain RWD-64-598) TaxID=741705 RepID=A0A5M3MDM9_CONPW|nr:Aldo keto reductase [Coniophora puteana RWD-64-598 SS2]EIW77233.1 Aldo keto reductase [Coniophora puteana RWD-64-598 SS2]
MSTPSRTRVPVIYGTGGFGKPGPRSNGARIHTVADAHTVLDVYFARGYTTLDTARLYGGGTSEEFLGEMDLPQGVTIDTKAFPGHAGAFSASGIRACLEASLRALAGKKIRTFYLHAPDRGTPVEETLKAIDELYKEGRFEEFGLSNHSVSQLANVIRVCNEHGRIKPAIYQDCYNAIERDVEDEIIPLLRAHSIRFYAYSPLAGGILTPRIHTLGAVKDACHGTSSNDDGGKGGSEKLAGTRWDISNSHQAPLLYQNYGWMIESGAVHKLAGELENLDPPIPLAQAAQRWLQHHSRLDPARGDAVVLGAATAPQLERNLDDCEMGPLPDDALQLVNDAWRKLKEFAPKVVS